MKTEFTPRDVETSNIGESSAFSFAASAKAFRIFIDGIYSDKIRAIVRELFTNAYDAHIAKGCKDKPFDVTLPSLLNPYFEVRDWGVSISHDNMMKRFTKVFDSTKDDSNDFVGALGLGRLSPFAYIDNFTVTTFIDGTMRVYSVFINTRSEPELAMMAETPTEEENGFKVSIPVAMKDITAFFKAVELTLIGFDVKPNFLNDNPPTLFEVKQEHGEYRVIDNLAGGWARQGCVIYPIDFSVLYDASAKVIASIPGIVVDFPIGALSFNASREGLGYDEKTKNNLSSRMEEIKNRILSDAQKLIDAETSVYNASKKFRELKKVLPTEVTNSLTYKGNPVALAYRFKRGVKKNVSMFRNTISNETKRLTFTHDRAVDQVINLGDIYEGYYFVANDREHVVSYTARIANHARENKIHQAVTFFGKMKDYNRIVRYTGNAPIVLVSSLPKPVVNHKPRVSTAGMVDGYRFSGGYGKMNKATVSRDDVGYYAIAENGCPRSISGSVVRSLMNLAECLGDAGNVSFLKGILWVPKTKESSLVRKGWKDAAPVVAKMLSDYAETYKDDKSVALLSVHDEVDLPMNADIEDTENIIKCTGNSALQEIFDAYNSIHLDSRRRAVAAYISDMLSVAGVKPAHSGDDLVREYEILLDTFFKKYPMAHFIELRYNISEEKMKIVLDYLSEKDYNETQELAIAA